MRLWVKITITIIILITLIFVYGRYINTTGFKVNEYTIKANIPDSFNGLKIVQISDINYLHTTDKSSLKRIIDRINLINPDIVVFTGDLLNIHIDYKDKDINNLKKQLSNINAKIAKYAIIGEEDTNFKEYKDILDESNFILLDNTYEYIYNKTNENILITGISDDIKKPDIISDTYNILLIHKPDNIDKLDYENYDLILSGHSINGYINIPGIKNLLLDKYSSKYYDNYYKINNTKLYISNGIGTKNIKFRIFNKPSINFFRINKK